MAAAASDALRVLGALTRERPVLLWLDDVHCSTESLEFAHYILSHQDDDTYPLCVVCTVPDLLESDAALTRLEAVEALDNVEQLDLEPLSDEEMRDLVGRMLGLSSALAELVVERTAGSPLFAVQLVEDWVARAALKLGPDGFAAPEEVALQIPDDIHATWQRRVDDVLERGNTPTASRIALEIAATLGVISYDPQAKKYRFASWLATGFSMLRGTLPSAARCTTASTPAKARKATSPTSAAPSSTARCRESIAAPQWRQRPRNAT